MLEPSTGDSFRKLAMRASGAGLAGGIGVLTLLAGAPFMHVWVQSLSNRNGSCDTDPFLRRAGLHP